MHRTMNKKCLIVDNLHTCIIPKLEDYGFEVNYSPGIQREEIENIIGDYHGIIVRSKTSVDKALLEKARKLEFIARAGAGLDLIDVEAVKSRNIQILNAPEGNRDALAEHAIAMLLSLFNKICQGNNQVKNGIWDREANRGVELHGKTVGIIGYGFMGESFAKRLSSFGCNVLAYDKYKSGFSCDYVKEVSLKSIKEDTDILSLHVPLTSETQNMVNLEFIDSFKKNIYILNTARGEIMQLHALKVQLEAGKVLGAALDVHEYEKNEQLNPDQREIFEYYKSTDNVLLTPHVGGWTLESYRKISTVLFEKIESIYSS